MRTSTLKRSTIALSTFAMFGFSLLGAYNTAIVSGDSFFSSSPKVSLIKRLDEINGKIIIGRLAASTNSWLSLKKDEKEAVKIEEPKKEIKTVEASATLPEPSIKEDLNLKLSNVFHKTPLEEGSFSGSAKTVDGVIEEINVTFPGGQVLNINTKERMVGNIFTYEDTYTREQRSGLFYEVKKGTYMITFTNDSQYAGTRLEFTAENGNEVRYANEYYEENINWGLNREEKMDNQKEPTISENAVFEFNFNG